MASYDLNQVLKDREAKKDASQRKDDKPLDLGDVSRVKVLSPGRQVFKRFIRNRLAVFGSTVLIIMFIFSFIGPLLYPYGQKQIFYTYSIQNVNYALAKQNTAYNGYVTDDTQQVERNIANAMNSNIKKMIAAGETEMVVAGEEKGYLIKEELPSVYSLSVMELTPVAAMGNTKVKVGTYSMIGKQFDFESDEIPGLAKDAASQIKGASGSFTSGDAEYTWEKGAKPKTFDVYTQADGLVYTGEEQGSAFEAEAAAAEEAGAGSFTADGADYVIIRKGSSSTIYARGEAQGAMLYTTYTVDTFETGKKVTDEFKVNALMAAVSGEKGFTADGGDYTIEEAPAGLAVKDADGNEYAEFGMFSIRRYSGEDTMAYDLKKAISEKVEDMLEAGEKSGILQAAIPMQNEDGSYSENEDGSFILNDTDLRITQRLEGEYVINCDQINFVIDMFAPPSAKHILGTDGDGFDVLARIMYGGRVSLMVGFVVVFLETLLGVIMGGLAGYFGGWVDNLIMRLVDIFYCLPSLPIMIILGAMMDAMRLDAYIRLIVMMAALGLMGWASVARLVRGQILSLREQEFMVATEATGIRIKDRIFKHLIPNVMPQLIVTATMGLGGVIITESTLSFLGLGVKHPLATWGTIINSVSSASAMAHYAFIWIPVGLLICFTVIAFNFVGDGLRDAYDPKGKR